MENMSKFDAVSAFWSKIHMKASDFNTSNYLNADNSRELIGKILKIYEVKSEEIREKQKLAIGFEGVEKLLIVNKSNRTDLSDAFGDETDNWIGESVKFTITKVMFEGKRVNSITIEPQTDKAPAAAPAEGKKKK
jgi:hypothetical protein